MTARESDRPRDLYALYASKNRLCTLCEDITPKKTAYNAYRNANRRVRRAERVKMYAVRDAYKVHTECIQAHKEVKREKFLSLLLLYTVCYYVFCCLRFQAIIFYRPRPLACTTPPFSPLRPRKKRPTSKGGAFRVTGRNQAVWRPQVGWRRPKPASVIPMQANAMTASMAPPTSRPVRARLGR